MQKSPPKADPPLAEKWKMTEKNIKQVGSKYFRFLNFKLAF